MIEFIAAELRKLEMPLAHARAFAALIPEQMRVEDVDAVAIDLTQGPGARLRDPDRNVELVLPVWLSIVVWELRQALLFGAPEPVTSELPTARTRPMGVRIHRDMAPPLFAEILKHLAPGSPRAGSAFLEAVWRLDGEQSFPSMIAAALCAVAPNVRLIERDGHGASRS